MIEVDSQGTQTSNQARPTKDTATQVDDAESVESILNVLTELQNEDLTILFQNIFHFLNEESKYVNIIQIITMLLSEEEQTTLFDHLGAMFNSELYKHSRECVKTDDITFDELIHVRRSSLYDDCDPRLKSFFASMTRKTKGNREISAENQKNSENQISSAYECLLKARNQKFKQDKGIRQVSW